MSFRAKICLTGAVGAAAFMIGFVHMKQEWEREQLHEGVIKDIERQNLRKEKKKYLENLSNIQDVVEQKQSFTSSR